MARAVPSPGLEPNGTIATPHRFNRGTDPGTGDASTVAEAAQLAMRARALAAELERPQEAATAAEEDRPRTPPAESAAEGSEASRLRGENLALRQSLAKLEPRVAEAERAADRWEEDYREQEKLMEEKSDLIRELHLKIQELQARPAAATPHEEELLALHEQLEQERKQLREDEESLMKQMREMEVQMSRERAELARQRTDLQRLQSEIQHELDLASRQAEIRQRLQPLQRRHDEMIGKKSGAPKDAKSPGEANAQEQPQGSGLFRRLFGG